jgi:hypothetical protein
MSDEIIIGIFTILGTVLGFGLTLLYDFFRERKEKRKYHTRFMIKLSNISGILLNIKSATEKMDRITTQTELKNIRVFLLSVNLKDELSKMEILLEKSISVDMTKSDILLRFEKLQSGINSLLILNDIHADKFEDIKPNIIAMTTMIGPVIDELIDDMYYQYTNKPQ